MATLTSNTRKIVCRNNEFVHTRYRCYLKTPLTLGRRWRLHMKAQYEPRINKYWRAEVELIRGAKEIVGFGNGMSTGEAFTDAMQSLHGLVREIHGFVSLGLPVRRVSYLGDNPSIETLRDPLYSDEDTEQTFKHLSGKDHWTILPSPAAIGSKATERCWPYLVSPDRNSLLDFIESFKLLPKFLTREE